MSGEAMKICGVFGVFGSMGDKSDWRESDQCVAGDSKGY